VLRVRHATLQPQEKTIARTTRSGKTRALHTKLKQMAAAHRRSVTQETIRLIEVALEAEEKAPSAPGTSYWATRKLIPEFEAALNAGAFSGGTDSTQIISEERDAR
jgi:hypothetical protein